MNSWSTGTKKNYNPHINAWSSYCKNKGVDMQSAITDVKLGIEFLTHIFRVKNLGYSAVNSARSALSTIIITGNNLTFGKQPLVCRLLKGMFREKPSLPRYTVTYDVNVVLKHLKNIDMNNISLKQLTLKVVTLLCFLTGHRDQSLNEIDLKSMFKDNQKIVFYIPAILKNTTPRFHTKPMILISYPDPSLCIVNHIDAYIKATKELRGDTTKLFISIVPPHKKVTTSTISRWVKEMLKAAGININTFSSHSTRAAATSQAKVKGLSLDEIRAAAGWANGTTFAKHYDKVIVKNFGQTIQSNID